MAARGSKSFKFNWTPKGRVKLILTQSSSNSKAAGLLYTVQYQTLPAEGAVVQPGTTLVKGTLVKRNLPKLYPYWAMGSYIN